MIYLKTLARMYAQIPENSPGTRGLVEVVSTYFWALKKVQKAFEEYTGTEKNPRQINPNPYDTPTYYLMKPSEQANVEWGFMDDVLTGKIKI